MPRCGLAQHCNALVQVFIMHVPAQMHRCFAAHARVTTSACCVPASLEQLRATHAVAGRHSHARHLRRCRLCAHATQRRARAAYFPAALNSLVHVVMYTYYFLASTIKDKSKRNSYLWWGRYVTMFQIAQFGMMLIQVRHLRVRAVHQSPHVPCVACATGPFCAMRSAHHRPARNSRSRCLAPRN